MKKTSSTKNFSKKSAQERKAEMDHITEMLENGVKAVFTSDEFMKYLDFCSRLYRYSANNQLLIRMQMPDASLVQSYTKWKECSRFVKKGEHGLKILAPIVKKHYKTDENGEFITDENGNKIPEDETPFLAGFKLVPTFDVSQTDGEPLPEICHELTGDVENVDKWIHALKTFINIPVDYEDIQGGAKGYYSLTENRIAIKTGLSDLQTIKTLIHECAHATLHTLDKAGEKTREQQETEAEAVAYVVSKHYGIDTSDYSFGYLASWATDKETPELTACLETIRTTAAKFIDGLDEIFEKDPEPSPEGDGPEKTNAEKIAAIDEKIQNTPVKLAKAEQPEEKTLSIADCTGDKVYLDFSYCHGGLKGRWQVNMSELFPLGQKAFKMILSDMLTAPNSEKIITKVNRYLNATKIYNSQSYNKAKMKMLDGNIKQLAAIA
jgi:hypothetical protein